MTALLWAAGGTGFTFLMTALGASLVFLLRRRSNPLLQRVFLGFAAGVMIAASVWSLLIPAIEEAEAAGGVGWLPAAGGFVLGILLMLGLDGLLPHLHSGAAQAEGLPSSFRRTTLLVLAVTLHNIPEGMAVGLTFARAAQHNGDAGLIAAAGALALGIGIQNFPEGACVAYPLRAGGMSSKKAFFLSFLSGMVEIFAAVCGAVAAEGAAGLMPWTLSFSAGAMIAVVCSELIPDCFEKHKRIASAGVVLGFALMMVLDLALG